MIKISSTKHIIKKLKELRNNYKYMAVGVGSFNKSDKELIGKYMELEEKAEKENLLYSNNYTSYYGHELDCNILKPTAETFSEAEFIYVENIFLNNIIQFFTRAINLITFRDIELYPNFLRSTGIFYNHMNYIDYYLLFIFIFLFYIFYKLIIKFIYYYDKLNELTRLKITVSFCLVLVLFWNLVYYLFDLDLFLQKYAIKYKENVYFFYLETKIVNQIGSVYRYHMPIKLYNIEIAFDFTIHIFVELMFYAILFISLRLLTKVIYKPAIIGILADNRERQEEQLTPQNKDKIYVITNPHNPNDIIDNYKDYVPLYETYEEKLFRMQKEQELKKYNQIRIGSKQKEDIKLKELEQQLLLMRKDKLLQEKLDQIRNREIRRLDDKEITELKREREIYKLNYEMIERKGDEIEKIKLEEVLKNRKALEKNKLIYEEQLEKAKKIEEYEKKK